MGVFNDLLSTLDALEAQVREQESEDLTRSLQVLLMNNGVPIEDRRVVYVDPEYQIRYPASRAKSIEHTEFGMSTDSEPNPLLRQFSNRIPRMVEDYRARKARGDE